MTRFRLFVAVLALGLLFGGCPRFVPVSPVLDVQVGRADGEPTFYFSLCGRPPGEAVSPRVIRVGQHAKDFGTGRVVCLLSAQGANGTLRNPWRYGEVPPGYAAQQPCEPLEPGRTYEIHASFAGGGMALFTMHKDGKISVNQKSCSVSP
jgi:hypothetical protein